MADAALFASVVAMGLAGGPHCAVMCGAAHAAIAKAASPDRPAWAVLAFQAGRVGSYALAGALAGAGLAALAALHEVAPLLRPLWVMAHVAAIAFAGWLVWSGEMPRFAFARPAAARLPQGLQRVHLHGRSHAWSAGLAGTCWAAVPCGLLQAALVVAALASTPARSAAAMAAFAVASALSLVAAPWLWLRLAGPPGRDLGATLVRIAGLLLLVAAGYAVWHDLQASVAAPYCTSAD
jgi:sulfite exporter TauE/SafE